MPTSFQLDLCLPALTSFNVLQSVNSFSFSKAIRDILVLSRRKGFRGLIGNPGNGKESANHQNLMELLVSRTGIEPVTY